MNIQLEGGETVTWSDTLDEHFAYWIASILGNTANARFNLNEDGVFPNANLTITLSNDALEQVTLDVNNPSSGAKSITLAGATLHIDGLVLPTFTPSGTSDAVGFVGEQCADDAYLYRKTAAGWKRAALATW